MRKRRRCPQTGGCTRRRNSVSPQNSGAFGRVCAVVGNGAQRCAPASSTWGKTNACPLAFGEPDGVGVIFSSCRAVDGQPRLLL